MTIELNDWFEQILCCRQRRAAATVTRCVRKIAKIKKEEKRIEAERMRQEELEQQKQEAEKEVRRRRKMSQSTGFNISITLLICDLHFKMCLSMTTVCTIYRLKVLMQ
jgi:hypothetical protein